jgi:hypothetical protein
VLDAFGRNATCDESQADQGLGKDPQDIRVGLGVDHCVDSVSWARRSTVVRRL